MSTGNTNTDPLTGTIQVKQAPEDEAMRHIEELENAVSTMKVEKVLTVVYSNKNNNKNKVETKDTKTW